MLVNRSKGWKINVNRVNTGDIVLIGDNNVKRIISLQLFPGKNGVQNR